MINIHSLLKTMFDNNASDLHIRVGTPPTFRVNGALYRAQMEPVTFEELERMCTEIMRPEQKAVFDKTNEFDFAMGLKGVGRFRINASRQRGTPSLAIRSIKTQIPAFTELGLPNVILDLAMKKRGLILCTGTTGSGKSTLLASMIDHINVNASVNVVTIEDPVEYLYKDKKSIIAQREIGPDTISFANALRASFRQDPDVILIGEIRDQDTMETAMSAADTGHLVMSTLHTMNAMETISRILSFFPPHQHQQVRLVLSSVLIAVISLRLLPKKDAGGRIPAAEIMINNAAVAEYILDPEKSHLIMAAICEGYTQYGSQSFDQSLLQLYRDDLITFQVAKQNASNPDDFELKVKGVEGASDRRWGG
ncbi:MAG TPA: type IV pilus twitching motility protein PilT [Chitinivibrionales bacterium]|jgi:twitching motility protein PilT|nr:type IV pilus twitching motility protein PilT [Chitinivibrionales bacterium]